MSAPSTVLKTVRCTQVLKKPLVIYLIIIFVTNCFAIATPFIRPFLYSIQMIDICVRLGEMNHNDPADIVWDTLTCTFGLHIWPDMASGDRVCPIAPICSCRYSWANKCSRMPCRGCP